jgi:hypothetical protein
MAILNFPKAPALNTIYTKNTRSWRWDGTVWKDNTFVFFPSAFFDATPLSAQTMIMVAVVGYSVYFPVNFAGSVAYAKIAPTVSNTFHIQKISAGVTTTVGTMVFASGAHNATFVAASAVTYIPGDIITIVAPLQQDATLSGIAFTLAGSRR